MTWHSRCWVTTPSFRFCQLSAPCSSLSSIASRAFLHVCQHRHYFTTWWHDLRILPPRTLIWKKICTDLETTWLLDLQSRYASGMRDEKLETPDIYFRHLMVFQTGINTPWDLISSYLAKERSSFRPVLCVIFD